jgi:putative membrane protein
MFGFVLRAVATAFGLWLASYLHFAAFANVESLILAAVVLGIVNAIVRPILVILTFPITILTLGLFLLVLNAGLILLVSHFVHGFTVHGWKNAIITAVITGVVSWIAHGLTSGEEQRQRG